MNQELHSYPSKDWTHTAAELTPTFLGAAVGLALGGLMRRETRRPVVRALGILGICSLVPIVVNKSMEILNGPSSKRGSRRTLRNIRDAGSTAASFADEEFDV